MCPDCGHIGMLSRLCVRLLMLPASFCIAGSFSGWLRLQKHDRYFWRNLALNYRIYVRAQGALACKFVGLCSFWAAGIVQQGSVGTFLRTVWHIFRDEGWAGLQAWCAGKGLRPGISYHFGRGPVPGRILVSDYRIPQADVSAGDLATMGILRDLAGLGYDVVFLPEDFTATEPYCQAVRDVGVEVVTRGGDYASPEEYIACEGPSFAAFYCIRLQVAESFVPPLRAVSPHTKVIFHAPDLAWLREGRQSRLLGAPDSDAAAKRQRELSAMQAADAVVVVSPVEKTLVEEALPTAAVELFPALYAPVPENVPPLTERKDIFFLGGFAHAPNADAVIWFVRAVWPQLHAQLPEARFRIVGAEMPPEVLELGDVPGVTVDGYVRDLEPLLDTLRVGVAPLRFGAGIKGKVALTLGAGIPCVCSPIAAEGMSFDGSLDILLAETASDYVEKLLRVYRDEALWGGLSREGRGLVRAHFGPEACRRCLKGILERALRAASPTARE